MKWTRMRDAQGGYSAAGQAGVNRISYRVVSSCGMWNLLIDGQFSERHIHCGDAKRAAAQHCVQVAEALKASATQGKPLTELL